MPDWILGPWPAPAKLNLLLRITGRRADGYHELQTVFQFIDRRDELFFAPRADGEVRLLKGVVGVPAEQDLTVRAARLLRAHTHCSQGVDIRIDKRLPMGGGLGGGSSDAATTLVALNRLWGLGLDLNELASLGLSLGADVPVFVRGRAAWAEGVGERLVPLALDEPWYLVLVPPCEVSTKVVFSTKDLTRDSSRITIADFVAGDIANDCLPVVRDTYPAVARALSWLDAHGGARLTGTGGCVFAVFADQASARRVLGEVPREYQAFIARGLNRSPLLDGVTQG